MYLFVYLFLPITEHRLYVTYGTMYKHIILRDELKYNSRANTFKT